MKKLEQLVSDIVKYEEQNYLTITTDNKTGVIDHSFIHDDNITIELI